MGKMILGGAALAAVMASVAALAQTGGHSHSTHSAHASQADAAPADTRQFVKFPEPLRSHTLANMRDHLLVLSEIQKLLAAGAFDKAADLAESRLGMSSLQSHGAHEVAKHMPKGMQDAGSAMHRSASQFARTTMDASVTGDLKQPLEALSSVSQTCVACHAGYRLH